MSNLLDQRLTTFFDLNKDETFLQKILPLIHPILHRVFTVFS